MTTITSSSAVDLQSLQKLEEQELISTQRHPSLDLLIHNYTPKCQYSKGWDELTLQCRGLITDLQGTIIARPFPKFFNLGEHEGHQVSGHEGFKLPPIDWAQDFVALKKYDGSLGIIYPTPHGPGIATRGSFTSDQAVRAREIMQKKGYYRFPFPEGMTFLTEIIFPQNRIVVDYGEMEDIVLLDVIDNATGRGCEYEALVAWAKEIGCPVVEAIPATEETLRSCGGSNPANEEGYVVRFEDGTRVKIKFEEYVRLHRLVTGVSAKSIWENLATGQGVEELLDRVPDEFNGWVRKTVTEITDNFEAVKTQAAAALLAIEGKFAEDGRPVDTLARKDWALEIVKSPDLAPILFDMLNGKDPAPIIWKKVRPVFSKPFHQDIDA